MMKILHVISDTNIGGAGILLLNFLKHVGREAFDISIIVPKGAALVSYIAPLGFKTIELDGVGGSSFNPRAIKGLCRVIKSESPSIVHCHASLSARIAARLCGKKVVHTRHVVLDSQEGKELRRGFVYRRVAWALSLLSHRIIATSPAARQRLIEDGVSARRVITIYNGVTPIQPLDAKERREARERYEIKNTDFVCSIIGRLERVKGHTHLLKAAKLIQDRDETIKFIIAGAGTERDALVKQADELGLNNCIFTGFIHDIERIHSITDLQINCSYTETSNQALLEGMSLGIPAAVTDAGGNPYVINDNVNGILFEVGDYVGLFEGIMRLKANPELYEKFSNKSKELYNEKFTARGMAEAMEKLYQELL